MGMIELGVTFSFAQLVIDDGIVEDIKDVIAGDIESKVAFDPELLSAAARKGFPPLGWSPHRARTKPLPSREREAARADIVETARHKVQSIIKHHKPLPLAPALQRRVREILLEEEDRRSWKQKEVRL